MLRPNRDTQQNDRYERMIPDYSYLWANDRSPAMRGGTAA